MYLIPKSLVFFQIEQKTDKYVCMYIESNISDLQRILKFLNLYP